MLLLLGWGIVDTLLMTFGMKKNSQYEGVIDGKWSVGYPGEGDSQVVQGKPSENGPGAVMILGTRSNSPMGMFADGKPWFSPHDTTNANNLAPGFKEVGDRFRDMLAGLEDRREESGCKFHLLSKGIHFETHTSPVMGMSSWISTGERSCSNEFATISYWRSVEDIHNFALSPIHREAWVWWNDTVAKHKHIGIMHEVFALPERNGWEGIYINYHPTGLGATTKAVEGSEKEGQKMWVNPIVDASRGPYRTSRGRMNRGDPEGNGNDNVARDPYA